jgi:very-short-patch-repair endonuclease
VYVSDGEFNYSIKEFGMCLCRDCQKDYAKVKENHKKKINRATPEAIRLWETLKKNGFDVELEKWDGYKHIDIAIPKYKVNIEVDGLQHSYNKKQALADLKRTYYSYKKGYITLRIPNSLVKNDLYETAKYIMEFLKASEEQLEKELRQEESLFSSFVKGIKDIFR